MDNGRLGIDRMDDTKEAERRNGSEGGCMEMDRDASRKHGRQIGSKSVANR
jgi:hypothetical protein